MPIGAASGHRTSFPNPMPSSPTDDEAQWLSKSMELTWLRLRQNRMEKIAPPEESANYDWSETERAFVTEQSKLWIVGSPETVKAKMDEKLAETQADEVMVTTTMHDYGKRLDSYRLLADIWGLQASANLETQEAAQ
jgi:alkanesulfonate monooxygenase SsuD/methylene tetrahydromethanopterin reductase-like flavin-dependent oxidoreductase (luciferase family)